MMQKHQFGLKPMVVARIMHGGQILMETSEKPKLISKEVVIPCKRYSELIAQKKRALPKLQKQLDEANKLKRESYVTMMSKRRKLK